VPPLADNLVREILATNGGTHMTVLRGHLS
jgi:hypothetical protein